MPDGSDAMRDQSDAALGAAFEKLFGSSNQLSRASLQRKLSMTPEFFFYADEMIEEGLARGILRPVPQASRLRTADDLILEFVDDPDRGSTLPPAARVR